MKKRTLLAALLVVPMGAVFAKENRIEQLPLRAVREQPYDESPVQMQTLTLEEYQGFMRGQPENVKPKGTNTQIDTQKSNCVLGTQAANCVTTGSTGPEAETYNGEATLGTQNKQSTGYITTGTLGTQSYSK